MSIDCIDSLGDVSEISGVGDLFKDLTTPLWNGRTVQNIERRDSQDRGIHQFFMQAQEHMEELAASLLDEERCDLIDLGDEMESNRNRDGERAFAFALPSRPDFVLGDSAFNQPEILECRSLLKTAVKGVKKCSKKVSKKVKKAAEKVAHFVKEHKTEILIGVAIAAVATGAVFLSGALVAGAVGTQVPNGVGGKKDDEDETQLRDSGPKTIAATGLTSPIQVDPKPIEPTISPPANPIKQAISGFFDGIQRGVSALFSHFTDKKSSSDCAKANSEPGKSCFIKTEGVKKPGAQIGFINGMNTSVSESMSHMEHLRQFVGDLHIEGVYNHSNTPPVDVAEIFLLNYAGVAPNTGKLLVENWSRFHKENEHNPDAKYLQFTHSMGNILTKDALQMAPQEIRDRVIVVAIAPAAIIPVGLCHDAYHYASLKDLVHYGENVHTVTIAAFNAEEEQTAMWTQLGKNKDQLVLLDPHEEAKGMDHGFESPTFSKSVKDHIQMYLGIKDKQGS